MSSLRPMRDAFLAQVRLRHVLVAVSAAHHGTTVSSSFIADGDEGRSVYLHPDSLVTRVAWDSAGVVLLAFDPGLPASEYNIALEERAPEPLFVGSPDTLRHLVTELVAANERLATAALWIAARGDGVEDVGLAGDDDAVELLYRAAHTGGHEAARILGEAEEVAPEVAAMAAALSARSALGPTTVTAAEEVMLLTPPPRSDPVPSVVDVRQARELLAELGIVWPNAEANARRVGDEVRRRREVGDQGLALLGAVHRGDLAAVAALVDGGANLEQPSPPGFLPYVTDGAPPLMVALTFRREALVKLLLERGADPNSQVGGTTPLVLAIAGHKAALCRALVEAGARLAVEQNGWTQSVLEHTRTHRDAEVMRVLLDAGAPLPRRDLCEMLADIARRSGADDLVPRLLPEP